jgi:hypothetical protein
LSLWSAIDHGVVYLSVCFLNAESTPVVVFIYKSPQTWTLLKEALQGPLPKNLQQVVAWSLHVILSRQNRVFMHGCGHMSSEGWLF